MLKRNGALVSVVPSEWMKSATSEAEVAFLDEATRCSSEITTEYDKDTYESTITTTRIVDLMHPEDYPAKNQGDSRKSVLGVFLVNHPATTHCVDHGASAN
jgi:hypothetical protein